MPIDIKSKDFANALFDFLYDNGLCLDSMSTGKSIEVGSGGDADWSVREPGQLNGPDYKTLAGALKSVNK